jgi:hypothetical protein
MPRHTEDGNEKSEHDRALDALNRRRRREREGKEDIYNEGRRIKKAMVIFYYLVFSPWAGLTGTRAQSGDQYGSGTLHSRQVLRGSLPLLSPAFRRSNFRRQMPPCPHQRKRS